MHMLAPGAPMDSSAGLRDRNMHAICFPTINRDTCPPGRAPTTPHGYFIRDSLVGSPHKSQPVSLPERDESGSHDKSGYLPPRQGAYNAPNVHPPTVSVLCALDLATYAGCEFLISRWPGSPPGMLYSVRSSYYGTFLVFRSLLKIETERRREGK